MHRAALLSLGLLLPMAAASGYELSVDGYYTADAQLRIKDRDSGDKATYDGGDGEGLRAVVWPYAGDVFLSAELSTVRDASTRFDVGAEAFREQIRLQQIRAGIGMINRSAFYSRIEFVRSASRIELSSLDDPSNANRIKRNATGMALHAGAAGALYGGLLGSLEVGFQDLDLLTDDDDGDLRFGRGIVATGRLDYPLSPRLQLFGEYRYQQGRSSNTGMQLQNEVSEARLGVRFNVR